jgi:malate dehydrogenase (oxaloacetate-decarboxylating)(NADP+)
VPPYVAQAAMDTGVARKPIADMEAYKAALARRLDPTAAIIQGIQDEVRPVIASASCSPRAKSPA